MTVKGAELVTLADAQKTLRKQERDIAEVLLKQRALISDIPYREMNEKVRHVEELRSDLPQIYYIKANLGIPASKTSVESREYNTAAFGSKSIIDVHVARRGGKDRIPVRRWNEAQAHIQSMTQEQSNLAFYGSPKDDDRKVPGFADVYSTLATTEPTSKQVVSCKQGTPTLPKYTSAFLVYWGEPIFGIYPAGENMGLVREDDGIIDHIGKDENNNVTTFKAYRENFEMHHGIVVKDYRAAGRVCNIDTNHIGKALGSGGATDAADLLRAMTLLHYRIPTAIRNANKGKGKWYVNSTIAAALHLQAQSKVSGGAGLRYENYQGEPVLMFLGNEIREDDTILNTEDEVTA